MGAFFTHNMKETCSMLKNNRQIFEKEQEQEQEQGFTLVELAIVMIIIGLLIGGVLKGQELINNAQVTSTITKMRSVDVATATFINMFSSFPGDMENPTSRLPSCSAGTPCANAPVASLGNGRLENEPGNGQDLGTEAMAFWGQLAAAELITGVNINPISVPVNGGDELMKADVGGVFTVGLMEIGGNDFENIVSTTYQGKAGHYLVLQGPEAEMGQGTLITASAAARIDRKLDDGQPNTGTVVVGGATDCVTARDNTGIYQESNNATQCGLFSYMMQ